MEYTENYHLNQWSMEDRIRMEDFNSDNQKIDAALKTLNTAVGTKANQSALTALQNTVNTVSTRAGVRKLKTGTPLAADAASYTITFDGIDCSQWKTLYLVIDVKTNSTASTVSIGSSAGNASGKIARGRSILIFYPFFDKTANAVAFYPPGGVYNDHIGGFSGFDTFCAVVFPGGSYKMLAGTTYEVWGEK